jgi:protein arginine N-methyltransferase 1
MEMRLATNRVRNEQFGVDILIRDRRAPFDDHIVWPSVGEYGVYDEFMYSLMTNDTVRSSLYEEAIQALVRGKVVLDIGTGRDMNWALSAARAGATKVYAVEQLESAFRGATELLAGLPERDRVILIPGISTEVELPERVDVCVSEIIGTIGSSEGVAASLQDARRRFMKAGGRMIPHACVTRIAGVKLPEPLHTEPGFDLFTLGYVHNVFKVVGKPFDLRVCVSGLGEDDLVTSVGTFEELSFAGAVATESVASSILQIAANTRLDGLLAWIELQCMEGGRRISSLGERTSWAPVFFPIWYPGVDVDSSDCIELTVHTSLSRNGVNPDYRIDAKLVRSDGSGRSSCFESLYLDSGFRRSAYYQQHFPTGVSVAR